MKIFIPGHVPSLKNSKKVFMIPIKNMPGKKRPMLVPSDAHKRYVKATQAHWLSHRDAFTSETRGMQKPLIINFKFIMGTRRKFDYTSPLDTVQDLMVDNGWIPDDNADEILPVLIKYEYNKEDPGVWISL